MRIAKMEAVHVRVPLDSPYVYSRGKMTAFESAIVRISTDDGIVGYGESAPLFRSPLADAAEVTKILNETIAVDLIDRDPFDIEMIVDRVLQLGQGNVDVVAGVDLALWDIMGKALEQPVYRLMGGFCQNPIAVDYTLSAMAPEDMAAAAAKVHQEGFHGVVVKITGKQLDEDVERVRQVRRTLPANCTVRTDFNGGYAKDEAIEFIKRISDMDIELVEQPVPPGDLEALKACRGHGLPINVDESLKTQQDAIELVSEKACDMMNIKIANVGGLLLAKRMAAIAAAAGLPVVVGGRTSLELSRCASRHFAASTPGTMGRKHEGPGPASQALSDDVVAQRTTRQMAAGEKGHVWVEQSPGLGLEVVWDKVMKYAVH